MFSCILSKSRNKRLATEMHGKTGELAFLRCMLDEGDHAALHSKGAMPRVSMGQRIMRGLTRVCKSIY